MYKYNLAAVLNTQRIDKNGNMPVRIRATINGKVTYFPTGIMLLKTQWDKDTKKVVQHPNKALLTTSINTRIADIEAEYVQQNLSGVNSPTIDRRERKDFYKYIFEKIEQNKLTFSGATITHQYSYLRKLKSFKPTLMFAEVNENLMRKFELFCSGIGNTANTISANTKFLKTHIHSATREGLFNGDPIKNFKGTKYRDPLRSVLTQEEITLLENFADNKLNSKKLVNVANYWILAAYTSLRYADIAKFDGLINDRILLSTQKTGAVVSILATEQIRTAIKRIKQPIFSNQKCNEYIGAVMAILGIDKKISFHNSRHSFGVLFIKNGGDIYKLSKIMGHSSVKTTMIYAQLANPTLDAEMIKVWGK